MVSIVSSLVTLLALFFACVSAEENEAVVLLDSFTFPIVVNKNSVFSTVVLIFNKRDISKERVDYIRSDYYELARSLEKNGHHVLFSQMVVNGGQNGEYAEKFQMTAESGPRMAVVQPNTGKFVLYDGGYAKDDMSRFIIKHTKDKLQRFGTLRSFNEHASEFMGRFMKGKTQDDVIDIAQFIDSLEDKMKGFSEEARDQASYYLKVMKTIMRKGIKTIPAELSRLQSLVDSKEVNAIQKNMQQIRRHIWEQFFPDSPEDTQYYDL